MNRRFEDLWGEAAHDGAACPVGVSAGSWAGAGPTSAELRQLMDAWYHERSQRIEGSLVLDEARRLLARLISEGEVSPGRRRQASRVIDAIRKLQDGGATDA